MRRKCVPSYYFWKLYQRLQSLSQGTKSVDKYFKEMELSMIRANVKKYMEVIMVRLMNGFNHDITHIVKLHHYVELEEMVYMVVNVEKQLKQKGTIQQS